MTEIDRAIAETARRNGLGHDSVRALFQALVAGRGTQAQFSHPELGGMGQWSGGMLQIGDMFNHGLKAKVAAVCADLADLAGRSGGRGTGSGSHQSQWRDADASGFAESGRRTWWPEELGQPASTGAQNDTRYACFPDRRRLVVERSGMVTIYDTGDHRISGFSQRQSTCSALAFTSQLGAVMLDGLRVAQDSGPTTGTAPEDAS